jgi:2-polyprenyl-3-methyl-5-hydroxy-6-metoxy-1,4-benzoquinol methylase
MITCEIRPKFPLLGRRRRSSNADVGVPSDRSTSHHILEEQAIAGLHSFVFASLQTPPRPGARAVDLGAGTGAFAQRLSSAGWAVEAVDRVPSRFGAKVRLHEFDLNTAPRPLGPEPYALVTALEVIEHVRDPIGFLTNIGELLDEDGLAVITTPNMDSLASRLRFLISGRLRQMDEVGDATHISPIFIDLLERRYLPAAKLSLQQRILYPPVGHLAVRPSLQRTSRVIGRLLPRSLSGDTNVFFLRRETPP